MKNPPEFKIGEVVRDIYSGRILIVLEPDKKGMAKLITESGYVKDLNAHNNPHFEKFNGQYKIKL